MSMTTAQCENLLAHYFENANHANVGDLTGLVASTSAGNWWVSLHSASPGETGNQTTNEISYTGYGRVSVARSGAAWNITSGADPAVASNAAAVTFGSCTAGTATANDFGVGYASTGTGNLFWFGALTSPLSISSGITPEFAIDAMDITLD